MYYPNLANQLRSSFHGSGVTSLRHYLRLFPNNNGVHISVSEKIQKQTFFFKNKQRVKASSLQGLVVHSTSWRTSSGHSEKSKTNVPMGTIKYLSIKMWSWQPVAVLTTFLLLIHILWSYFSLFSYLFHYSTSITYCRGREKMADLTFFIDFSGLVLSLWRQQFFWISKGEVLVWNEFLRAGAYSLMLETELNRRVGGN